MKNKILVFLVMIFGAFNSFAEKPKIITSFTPIASIVSMLLHESADVAAINTMGGCPHHYQMRPSDYERFKDSDILIYVDEGFDSFAANFAKKFDGQIIKISDFKTINFKNDQGADNFHFWLNLESIVAFHEELAEILIAKYPELKSEILKNKSESKQRLESLMREKNKAIAGMGEIILLSDSMEHLFRKERPNIVKIYQNETASLRDFERLESLLKTHAPQCLIIDNGQKASAYEKFNKKIIQIDSENWEVGEDMTFSWELFCAKYEKIINQLKSCR